MCKICSNSSLIGSFKLLRKFILTGIGLSSLEVKLRTRKLHIMGILQSANFVPLLFPDFGMIFNFYNFTLTDLKLVARKFFNRFFNFYISCA